MIEGIYEELVTQLIEEQLNDLDDGTFYVQRTKIDKEEASSFLSKHLSRTIKNALKYVRGDNPIELQIEIANKIILFLKEELKKEEFENDLISIEGEILKSCLYKS